jgi:hypothetical protein
MNSSKDFGNTLIKTTMNSALSKNGRNKSFENNFLGPQFTLRSSGNQLLSTLMKLKTLNASIFLSKSFKSLKTV